MQITNKQLVINIKGYLNKLWNVNSITVDKYPKDWKVEI
jgi:hypothetical protein